MMILYGLKHVEIITTLTYICIVNHFYFIVVLTARTRTFRNATQQDAKHKDIRKMLFLSKIRIRLFPMKVHLHQPQIFTAM
jgi:hypothetical protein